MGENVVEGTRNGVNEAHPMKGGVGPYNYAKNSMRQLFNCPICLVGTLFLEREESNAAKELIKKAIAEKLKKEILLSYKTLCIADLGCSVGPNTFFAVQNIVEALESKYKQCQELLNLPIPEFQVFFSDHALNNFNLLFASLPQDVPYYAAGVPGSFHGRLFPKASLHFVHSAIALHWLSRAPKEVLNKNSLAWNKGRIHYSNSGDEVVRAYKARFVQDMELFLQARAQEIVHGGLMVLVVSGISNDTHHSLGRINMVIDLLGSCLMELAKKGIVSEEKVDNFNIPMYYLSPQELEASVERNGYFSVERIEGIFRVESNDLSNFVTNAQEYTSYIRSGMEGMFKQHFGEEILDVLFDSFRKKIEENRYIFKPAKALIFLVVLKRNAAN